MRKEPDYFNGLLDLVFLFSRNAFERLIEILIREYNLHYSFLNRLGYVVHENKLDVVPDFVGGDGPISFSLRVGRNIFRMDDL